MGLTDFNGDWGNGTVTVAAGTGIQTLTATEMVNDGYRWASRKDYYYNLENLTYYSTPESFYQATQRVDCVTKEKEKSMFKVGDKVKVISGTTCCTGYVGLQVTVLSLKDNNSWAWVSYDGGNSKACIYLKYLELIKEETTMELQPLTDLSNLIQRTFNDETKTLYRAGYLTKELNVTKKLTDAVSEMFVGHIIDGTIEKATLATFATELITRAEDEIAEEEKKSN